MQARCPSCGVWIYLEDDVELGDQVECLECGKLLKVVRLRPLKLDYYFGSYEDEEENGDGSDEDYDEDREPAKWIPPIPPFD